MSNYFYQLNSPVAKALIGTAVVAVVSGYLIYCRNKRKSSALKADYKAGVVYLFQFPRTKVIPSLSSYCLKLETWLRMADINYENVECSPLTRSSKGLLPFVELNGRQYADSGFIIRGLMKIFNKFELDSDLTDEQKACARAFEQMVENSTYPSNVYVRFVEKTDEFFSEDIMGQTSFFMKLPFFRWAIKRNIKARLYGHGIGRHNRDEIMSIGFDDLRALSTYIGAKMFFGGDEPTTVDASLFGFLAQLAYIPIDTPHGNFLNNECPNLVEYCDRMKNRYWPDWDEICATRSLHTTWKKHI